MFLKKQKTIEVTIDNFLLQHTTQRWPIASPLLIFIRCTNWNGDWDDEEDCFLSSLSASLSCRKMFWHLHFASLSFMTLVNMYATRHDKSDTNCCFQLEMMLIKLSKDSSSNTVRFEFMSDRANVAYQEVFLEGFLFSLCIFLLIPNFSLFKHDMACLHF